MSVSHIVGISGLPETSQGVGDWLKRHDIPPMTCGKSFRFQLSDLPERERLSFLRRELDAAGLDLGTRDDDAHDAYLAARPKARAEAERRAAMVRLVKSLPDDTSWSDRLRLLRG